MHFHILDIRADDFDKSGAGVIGLQAGSNKGASQSGILYIMRQCSC